MTLSSAPEFHAVLASAVHELKNSLANVNRLIQDLTDQFPDSTQEKILLEFETNRMNNYLMQLLVLYKIEAASFSPRIDEHMAEDILVDVIAVQEPLLSLNKLQLLTECEENLLCYCDIDLITNCLNTLVQNAHRYANLQIKISAKSYQNYVAFYVEDDGPGLPEDLLTNTALNSTPADLKNCNFGLGLYFAETIAKMHKNANYCGYLQMDNQSELGGARFALFLP